ncbi:MAG: hypothetical protein A2104_03285 [Candidatus Melainabacteria bacterium GWF2_32_7]|nr:MAG: hypothetical protein A2104_03285 [Candidatus Melainabacteria bacterium GWF2_32_7]
MDIIFFDLNLSKFSLKPYYSLSQKSYLPANERDIETLFSMGNGYIGTRNSLEEFYPYSTPGTFLAGFYEKDIYNDFNILVKTPDWTSIKIFVEDEQLDLTKHETLFHRRYIDLNNGCAVREWRCADNQGRITGIKIIKFISISNKHELGKSVLIKPENYTGNLRVLSGIDCNTADFNYLINQNLAIASHASVQMKSKFSDKEFMMLQKSVFSCIDNILSPTLDTPKSKFEHSSSIEFNYQTINNFGGSFEEWKWLAEVGKIYNIKSLTTIYNNMDTSNPKEAALENILELGHDFFETGAQKHVEKWFSRWNESIIKIKGCECDQKYIDFALYHLIISGEFSGDKYSIPARNLSGEAYKGHVFWDTEMFLLPFFTYTKPEIARKLLLYRYNTLDGARYHAREEGFKGASFAWESTDTGREMTPSHAILPNGNVIYILSGQYENHLSSDIAYTVWKYWQATEDMEFLVNYGAEILFETARFCESLISLEDDGICHILTVIGPDEYHEKIDDNAYTNYLVRHNLEIAVLAYEFMENNYSEELLLLKKKISLKNSEVKNWKNYAGKIYSGFDEKTGLFEQFSGFYDLEYVDLKQFEPRSVPMDIIFGSEKTQKSQVIKQTDVLMFLFLFGENFSEDIIRKNYEFYEPRTGHGSSLSPSIHSIIAARIGKIDEAYKYFIKNAKIDLNDEFGNSAGGIHIASLGGVWMSVAMGFAGMYPAGKGLIFNPHLPEEWENIEFSVKWHGQDLNINLNKEEINFTLSGDKNIFVSLGNNNWKELESGLRGSNAAPLMTEEVAGDKSQLRNAVYGEQPSINKNYIGIQTNGNWKWKD